MPDPAQPGAYWRPAYASPSHPIDSNATPADEYQVWTLKGGRVVPPCPGRPDLPVAFDVDPACFGGVVHCARLWGVDTSSITAALERTCAPHENDATMCEVSMSAWLQIAKSHPPFTLK